MDLDDDARLVVDLALDPPEEIARVAEDKGGTPRNYRSTIRQHLRYNDGWDAERVAAAFGQIKAALAQS